MELDRKQKIGLLMLVVAATQFFFIFFGVLSPTVFSINDEDSANVLSPGGSAELVIGHSIFHTNRFIVAIGQEFTYFGQPSENGNISLENKNTGEVWNESYSIVHTSSYTEYKWAVKLWDLPTGGYILRDSNGNSDKLDYRIINAGYFRNVDPEYATGDSMDSNELTVFIISMIGGIILGLIGLRFIYKKGALPDYRKTDHTKKSYKLPKQKAKKKRITKKDKILAEKEAILDDFEERIKPKESKVEEEKWEWE